MTHVFISYSTKDVDEAEILVKVLEGHGIQCWYSARDIPPGAPNWAADIIEAIDSCEAFIFVYSSNSNASEHAAKEISRAYDQKKRVIPFRIEDVPLSKDLAYYLSSTNWFDAITPPRRDRIDALALYLLANRGSGTPLGQQSPPVRSQESNKAAPGTPEVCKHCGMKISDPNRIICPHCGKIWDRAEKQTGKRATGVLKTVAVGMIVIFMLLVGFAFLAGMAGALLDGPSPSQDDLQTNLKDTPITYASSSPPTITKSTSTSAPVSTSYGDLSRYSDWVVRGDDGDIIAGNVKLNQLVIVPLEMSSDYSDVTYVMKGADSGTAYEFRVFDSYDERIYHPTLDKDGFLSIVIPGHKGATHIMFVRLIGSPSGDTTSKFEFYLSCDVANWKGYSLYTCDTYSTFSESDMEEIAKS